MTPDKSRCSQCETPLLYTKYSKTFRGRLERLVQKVGTVTVIGVAGLALLLFLAGGLFLAFYIVGNRADADGATTVNTVVNDSFTALSEKPASFKVVIPRGARNSRIVGGFKVTSGSVVNFYIVGEDRFAEWSSGAMKAALTQREQTNSNKIRQSLQPGTYYLLFANPDPAKEVKVAAEFYAKYD